MILLYYRFYYRVKDIALPKTFEFCRARFCEFQNKLPHSPLLCQPAAYLPYLPAPSLSTTRFGENQQRVGTPFWRFRPNVGSFH